MAGFLKAVSKGFASSLWASGIGYPALLSPFCPTQERNSGRWPTKRLVSNLYRLLLCFFCLFNEADRILGMQPFTSFTPVEAVTPPLYFIIAQTLKVLKKKIITVLPGPVGFITDYNWRHNRSLLHKICATDQFFGSLAQLINIIHIYGRYIKSLLK